MELVTPDIGLIFWTTVTFLLLVFVLGKFAWKPILKMVKEREDSINEALKSAETARAELQNLQSDNERILAEARAERDAILKEARDFRAKMVEEAKQTAKNEGQKMIDVAREQIENEKKAAITELKNQVAILSIEVAEKVIRLELEDTKKHQQIIDKVLEEIN